MNYLLDTNILSELAKPQPAGDVMAGFVRHEPHLYVSSILLGEIRKGLELLLTGKRKASLQAWFKAVCESKDGRVLSFNTSTAQRHGLIIVTRNIADFKDVGVKLINPFTA